MSRRLKNKNIFQITSEANNATRASSGYQVRPITEKNIFQISREANYGNEYIPDIKGGQTVGQAHTPDIN
jgi:hypothetical protein